MLIPFEAGAHNRYVTASATGSDNGLSIGAPWTLAQMFTASAAGGLNGCDIWISGNHTLGAASVFASGNLSNRPVRLLGFIATPGDNVARGSQPTINVSGVADISRAFNFNALSSAVVANLRFDRASKNATSVVLDVGGCQLIDCNFAGGTGTNQVNWSIVGTRAVGIVNETASQYSSGLFSGSLAERCSAQGTGGGSSFCFATNSNGDHVSRCIGVNGTVSLRSKAHISKSILTNNSNVAVSLDSLSRESAVEGCILVGASVATVPSHVSLYLYENVIAPASGTTPLTIPSGRVISENNEFLAGNPFLNSLTGDLRLSAVGRVSKRCVDIMLDHLTTPLLSGWQMDSEEVLRGYAAAIENKVYFNVGGNPTITLDNITLTTTNGTVTTLTPGSVTYAYAWEQFISDTWETVPGATTNSIVGVSGRSYRSVVSASKDGKTAVSYSVPVLVPPNSNEIVPELDGPQRAIRTIIKRVG